MSNCTQCKLHKYRHKQVRGRGTIPADILFIGEAPGKTEDLRGTPFIGKAGKVLDRLLRDAEVNHTYYITNIVQCRPTDSICGDNREPLPREVWACRLKLMKVYKKVNPKVIIFLGRVAERFLGKTFPEGLYIVHPSYLARGGGPAHPEYRLTVKRLKQILKEAL